MDLPGASYLYALATLSITFSGFSALIMVLRQASDRALSHYDAFLMVNYFLTGFAIAVLCLLPPLLAGWTTSNTVVWRVPSVLAVVIGIAVEIGALVRGRRVPRGVRPSYLIAALTISYWPAFLLLLMSAGDVGVQPGFGPYAAALTWVFAIAGIDYMVALGVLFKAQLLE